MALYHEKMTRYHYQRVKLKLFNPRNMVLRKVSQATKDPTQGKLGPNWEGSYKVIQGHSILKKRELLLRRCEWKNLALSLECRAPQEVLSVKKLTPSINKFQCLEHLVFFTSR